MYIPRNFWKINRGQKTKTSKESKSKVMDTAVAEAPIVNETSEATRIDKGGYYVELVELDDSAKGFSFYKIQFKTLEAFLEHMGQLGQDGKEVGLALVNRSIAFSMRNKAKNRILDEKDRNDKRQRGETLLIEVDDAEKYVPGARDINSMSGLQTAINESKKEALKAKNAGDLTAYEAHKAKVKELFAQLQTLIDAV